MPNSVCVHVRSLSTAEKSGHLSFRCITSGVRGGGWGGGGGVGGGGGGGGVAKRGKKFLQILSRNNICSKSFPPWLK